MEKINFRVIPIEELEELRRHSFYIPSPMKLPQNVADALREVYRMKPSMLDGNSIGKFLYEKGYTIKACDKIADETETVTYTREELENTVKDFRQNVDVLIKDFLSLKKDKISSEWIFRVFESMNGQDVVDILKEIKYSLVDILSHLKGLLKDKREFAEEQNDRKEKNQISSEKIKRGILIIEDLLAKADEIEKIEDIEKKLKENPTQEEFTFETSISILGRCNTRDKEISIYCRNIESAYHDKTDQLYCYIGVFVHEFFHAYFDKTNHNSYIEEPIVEYCTLKFLDECCSNAFEFYSESVKNKKTAGAVAKYGFGYDLYTSQNTINYLKLFKNWDGNKREGKLQQQMIEEYEKNFKYWYPRGRQKKVANLLFYILCEKLLKGDKFNAPKIHVIIESEEMSTLKIYNSNKRIPEGFIEKEKIYECLCYMNEKKIKEITGQMIKAEKYKIRIDDGNLAATYALLANNIYKEFKPLNHLLQVQCNKCFSRNFCYLKS